VLDDHVQTDVAGASTLDLLRPDTEHVANYKVVIPMASGVVPSNNRPRKSIQHIQLLDPLKPEDLTGRR